jgi:hypothetical protein
MRLNQAGRKQRKAGQNNSVGCDAERLSPGNLNLLASERGKSRFAAAAPARGTERIIGCLMGQQCQRLRIVTAQHCTCALPLP